MNRLANFLLSLLIIFFSGMVYFSTENVESDLLVQAREALHKSNTSKDPSEKIEHLCDALSFTGTALSHDPHHARWLIAWSNLRQILGESDCGKPYTTGSYLEALERGLAESPLNSDVLVGAAQIFSWTGNTSRSWELLRRALLFDRGLTEAQRQAVIALLNSPEAVQAAVPAQFPQASLWANALTQSNNPEVREMVPSLQLSALHEMRRGLVAGVIPAEIARDHLIQLFRLTVKDNVRKEADSIASEVFRRENAWNVHRYFGLRSTLTRFDSPVGSVFDDLKPLQTPLSGWERVLSVNLDDLRMSIGVFTGGVATKPKMIELVFDRKGKMPPLQQLKLLVSPDNISWEEAGFVGHALAMSLGDFSYVALMLPDEKAVGRYWKIHFQGATALRSCNLQLPSAVRVYG